MKLRVYHLASEPDDSGWCIEGLNKDELLNIAWWAGNTMNPREMCSKDREHRFWKTLSEADPVGYQKLKDKRN